MSTLRILAVGSPEDLERISSTLTRAGHSVVEADTLEEASEALSIQRFDAVLLAPDLAPDAIAAFAAKARNFEQASTPAARVSILAIAAGPPASVFVSLPSGIDGIISDELDPDALTEALTNLAQAVAPKSSIAPASPAADLPVLDIEELKAQVAYDDELLVELIDLYLSERVRQSSDMKQALENGQYEHLGNIAHTLKGSLASLHAAAARTNAQTLEFAAKDREDAKCRRLLAVLEHDLDLLEERLTALRQSITSS